MRKEGCFQAERGTYGILYPNNNRLALHDSTRHHLRKHEGRWHGGILSRRSDLSMASPHAPITIFGPSGSILTVSIKGHTCFIFGERGRESKFDGSPSSRKRPFCKENAIPLLNHSRDTTTHEPPRRIHARMGPPPPPPSRPIVTSSLCRKVTPRGGH